MQTRFMPMALVGGAAATEADNAFVAFLQKIWKPPVAPDAST